MERWAVTLWLVMVAPAVGSFLALLVDRLPRGEPVVAARSCCRACGTALGWADLVPVWSWLRRRGRCGQCGAAIPADLLLAELAALALALAVVARGGTAMQMGLTAGWLWALLGLGLADLRWFRLPDALSAALLACGLGLAVVQTGDMSGLPPAALTGAVGAGVLMALRLGYQALRGREGMGLGDVKLMAGIGAGIGAQGGGPRELPLLFLIAAGSALLVAVTLHLRRGGGLRGGLALPFGSYLCLAAGLVWLTLPPPG